MIILRSNRLYTVRREWNGPGRPEKHRHLNREQVRDLIHRLNIWGATPCRKDWLEIEDETDGQTQYLML